MADVVRLALDVVVEKGDPKKVAEALFENREAILGFATAVILKENEVTAEMKIKKAAGGSHHHDPSADGGKCSECVRYSGRILLAKVQSYE